jgi:hypothetical protein
LVDTDTDVVNSQSDLVAFERHNACARVRGYRDMDQRRIEGGAASQKRVRGSWAYTCGPIRRADRAQRA